MGKKVFVPVKTVRDLSWLWMPPEKFVWFVPKKNKRRCLFLSPHQSIACTATWGKRRESKIKKVASPTSIILFIILHSITQRLYLFRLQTYPITKITTLSNIFHLFSYLFVIYFPRFNLTCFPKHLKKRMELFYLFFG